MTDELSSARYDPGGRFTGLAQIYAKSRPTYPNAAIDFIIEKCALTEKSYLVDVGCGTGISSRLFAERKIPTVGIDPNDDMRQVAIKENKQEKIEWLSFNNGSAEKTGLPDGVADVVVAAQAFHWFRPEPTLKEFVRILKPNGFCVLMWNERDDRDKFTSEYSKILQALPNTKDVELKRGDSGKDFFQSPLFHSTGKVDFENEQSMDKEGLLGRAFSASYAPKSGELFVRLKMSLEDLFDTFERDGQVVMKYITSIYFGISSVKSA